MKPNKTRTFIVRSGTALGMIIFAVACWYYGKMKGADEFEDIMRYQFIYRVLMGVAFFELLALSVYQIKPHLSRSKVEITKEVDKSTSQQAARSPEPSQGLGIDKSESEGEKTEED